MEELAERLVAIDFVADFLNQYGKQLNLVVANEQEIQNIELSKEFLKNVSSFVPEYYDEKQFISLIDETLNIVKNYDDLQEIEVRLEDLRNEVIENDADFESKHKRDELGRFSGKDKSFLPKENEEKTFISDLRRVEKGELTKIRIVNTPLVYKSLGMKDGIIKTSKEVIYKDSIGKHNVNIKTIENLPRLISDPLIVMKSLTDENRFVAVVDAKDDNGKQIIVAISPNKQEKGGYHFIPSFYGKDEFNNFLKRNIEQKSIRYIKSPQVLDTLQLRSQTLFPQGFDYSIIQKKDIVK